MSVRPRFGGALCFMPGLVGAALRRWSRRCFYQRHKVFHFPRAVVKSPAKGGAVTCQAWASPAQDSPVLRSILERRLQLGTAAIQGRPYICLTAFRRARALRFLQPSEQKRASARRKSGTGSVHHGQHQPPRRRFCSTATARRLRVRRFPQAHVSNSTDRLSGQPAPSVTPCGSGAGMGGPFSIPRARSGPSP